MDTSLKPRVTSALGGDNKPLPFLLKQKKSTSGKGGVRDGRRGR